MLGFKFIKAQPTTYLMAFKQGRAVREGAGLSLIYYAPTTNLVAVPIGSREAPFLFEKVTADFQTVRIQGQISFRIGAPVKAAAILNFALKPDAVSYESDDPTRVPQRIVSAAEVLVQTIIQAATLTEAIRGSRRFHNLPIILVTAKETDADKARGLAAGADAYQIKSAFDQKDLLTTIQQIL